MITIADIDSTIGGALGNTHGSCLPLASKIASLPYISHVFYGFPIVETGLKATVKYYFIIIFIKYFFVK